MECQGCVTFGCLNHVTLFSPIDEEEAQNWLYFHGLTWQGICDELINKGDAMKCDVCGSKMKTDDKRKGSCTIHPCAPTEQLPGSKIEEGGIILNYSSG